MCLCLCVHSPRGDSRAKLPRKGWNTELNSRHRYAVVTPATTMTPARNTAPALIFASGVCRRVGIVCAVIVGAQVVMTVAIVVRMDGVRIAQDEIRCEHMGCGY